VHSYERLKRSGPRPKTSGELPHQQLDQIAPVHLQEELFARAVALAGVTPGESLVSVPGARAFHMPGCSHENAGAFMLGCEFAHLHPPYDGSLHMTLPPEAHRTALDNGWAERHPLAGRRGFSDQIVLVYGPRDDEELEVVTALLEASHRYASGSDQATKSPSL